MGDWHMHQALEARGLEASAELFLEPCVKGDCEAHVEPRGDGSPRHLLPHPPGPPHPLPHLTGPPSAVVHPPPPALLLFRWCSPASSAPPPWPSQSRWPFMGLSGWWYPSCMSQPFHLYPCAVHIISLSFALPSLSLFPLSPSPFPSFHLLFFLPPSHLSFSSLPACPSFCLSMIPSGMTLKAQHWPGNLNPQAPTVVGDDRDEDLLTVPLLALKVALGAGLEAGEGGAPVPTCPHTNEPLLPACGEPRHQRGSDRALETLLCPKNKCFQSSKVSKF